MLMSIGTSVKFDAAHFIPDHPKCGHMHGHTWKVDVEYDNIPVGPGLIHGNGMLVDFGVIKQLIKDRYDHGIMGPLNNVVEIPTAENIAMDILWMMPTLNISGYVLTVTVWESKVSFARAREFYTNA